MFTGIIETMGHIKEITSSGTNKSYWIASDLSSSLAIDQSVSHDGVCLTVESAGEGVHKVTAVEETIHKTCLGKWQPGMYVNLERSLLPTSRLDGHLVQGHTDTTGTLKNLVDREGSFVMTFKFKKKYNELIIEKGSVSVNGVSLTAYKVTSNHFSVSIIPYTYQHTNLQYLQPGDQVNIEFDMVGKYILRKLSLDK